MINEMPTKKSDKKISTNYTKYRMVAFGGRIASRLLYRIDRQLSINSDDVLHDLMLIRKIWFPVQEIMKNTCFFF